MTRTFQKQSLIAAPAERVFAFHERPDALRLLIPPRQPVRIVSHTGGIRDGARVELRMGYWPLLITWVAVHRNYIAGRQFQDVQERGPFRAWEHTHIVTPVDGSSCTLTDRILYQVAGGALGAWFVNRALRATFLYRHAVTARETAR